MSTSPTARPPGAPSQLPAEASAPLLRVARVVARPLERFLAVEAASGILLIAAAAVALIWANSPWKHAYHDIWETPLVVVVGELRGEVTLHFVVNDVLMTVFFFVVGLEIRREIHAGELSDLRRASLPTVAALGGMVVPVIIYLAVTRGEGDVGRGWSVPMATDIAFAVGVLALLGKRVPPALRVLLLALAIIDDIGAILVIALFYSNGIGVVGLVVAATGIAAILVVRALGTRSAVAYLLPGIAVWAGVLAAGIHPTIAGVIVGLLTPARRWYGVDGFLAAGREHLAELARRAELPGASGHDLVAPLEALRRAQREAISPVERLEAKLHPWVAFGIMPLFALANAGVTLEGLDLGVAPTEAIGIAAGLVIGKPLGVILLSRIGVALGVSSLPRGVTWGGIALVGMVAGIGFTMALFISALAFESRADLHGIAKLSVLGASAIAALLALALGRLLLPARPPQGTAATADEAEASTDA